MIQETPNSAQEELLEENNNLEKKELQNNSIPDFNEITLKEIVQYFEEMLQREDHQEMYKYADTIKAAFYKTLKKEKISMGLHTPLSTTLSDTSQVLPEDVSVNPFAEIERGFKDLYSRYKIIRQEFIRELEKQKEENLVEKNKIIQDFKELLEGQEDLQHTFPAFRELQNRWKSIGPVPQAYNKDLWETYQFLVEKFYDYVKINNELRDLDFKKNLDSKRELCLKAEELMNEPNVVIAFRKLQKYHEEWREIGPVAKELRDEVWERFKNATSKINKKQQEHFEGLKAEQKRNLELKLELCTKAEKIANIEDKEKDWSSITKEMQKLQSEWRKIGFALRKENQKAHDRFKKACDKFYDEKRDYYASFKKTMQDNLKIKQTLCEQAEAVMNSEEWRKTTDYLISLQKQWKEVGPISKKQSDAIWKRFRAACDHFFDRKSQHHSMVEENFEDNLKQKRELIEEINQYTSQENSSDDNSAFKEFQKRWSEIGFVPMKEKEKIQAAYKKALQSKFPNFKAIELDDTVNRYKKHISNVKSSARGDRGVKAERDKLFQKFKQLEQDIILWENNIGFFAKSKNADNIIRDFKEKISNAKEEMTKIEEKIKVIDKQYQ